ncbi:MAG: aminomethyl transferase family protein [Chloracidobacterium sp.]|nr:aminomethyl transferase family protein [Chloracidobacterium sp.]
MDIDAYTRIRSGGIGYIEMPRGLIAVWGKEAVQFLDGMITNDMKTLGDGEQMLAAFPNAQGRLIAVIRVLRQGDRFLIETEDATREKVYQNLFRFTFAGDFFVEDLSETYRYFEVFPGTQAPLPASPHGGETDVEGAGDSPAYEKARAVFRGRGGSLGVFVEIGESKGLIEGLSNSVVIDDELYETLRIEAGIPRYGIDMDETTIVPELGLDGLISYTKGCYIGQEIIARIHFRGHVAKQLTGLVLRDEGGRMSAESSGSGSSFILHPSSLTAPDGKPAGRITSVTYSPKLDKTIALAYVRYEFLAEGTELKLGDHPAKVRTVPFID